MAKKSKEDVNPVHIAEVVHAALRAWNNVHGEPIPPDWGDAPKWMHDSTLESVEYVLKNPKVSSGSQHKQWLKQKKRDGWKYGPVKDEKKKTHPMMVPFKDLPDFEKRKDTLLNAIVVALSSDV